MSSSSKKSLTEREKRRLKWWKEKQTKSADSEGSPTKPQERSKRQLDNNVSKSSSSPDVTPKKKKKNRKKTYYIVFVGNLPYSVTAADVHEHFLPTGGIKDVRLLTDKDTGKSRGCAYVEFEDRDAHRRALQMHHSEMCGRKINVEFTSAGRKTDRRMAKLKEKNLKAARFRMKPGTTLKSKT